MRTLNCYNAHRTSHPILLMVGHHMLYLDKFRIEVNEVGLNEEYIRL